MNQPSFPLLFSGKARDLERKWKFALWNFFRNKGEKVGKKRAKNTFILIHTLLSFISAFSGKAKSIQSLFFLPVSSTVSSNNTLFRIIIFPSCTCVKSEYISPVLYDHERPGRHAVHAPLCVSVVVADGDGEAAVVGADHVKVAWGRGEKNKFTVYFCYNNKYIGS